MIPQSKFDKVRQAFLPSEGRLPFEFECELPLFAVKHIDEFLLEEFECISAEWVN